MVVDDDFDRELVGLLAQGFTQEFEFQSISGTVTVLSREGNVYDYELDGLGALELFGGPPSTSQLFMDDYESAKAVVEQYRELFQLLKANRS